MCALKYITQIPQHRMLQHTRCTCDILSIHELWDYTHAWGQERELTIICCFNWWSSSFIFWKQSKGKGVRDVWQVRRQTQNKRHSGHLSTGAPGPSLPHATMLRTQNSLSWLWRCGLQSQHWGHWGRRIVQWIWGQSSLYWVEHQSGLCNKTVKKKKSPNPTN